MEKRVIKLFCLVISSVYRKNDSVTVIIHPATINVCGTTGICLNPFVLKKVVIHREESYTCSTSLMHEITIEKIKILQQFNARIFRIVIIKVALVT